MAAALDPDEVLHSTAEKANFQRVTRLLISGGSSLLREIFDAIHPPSNLPTILSSAATKKQLKAAKLTKPQWDCLYPSPGVYGESEDFDVTLLFRLLRTICNLIPPPTGWDALPASTDHSLTADLARVKYYRNSIYAHVNQGMEIKDDEFPSFWQEISQALVRIAGQISLPKKSAWQGAIDNLLNDPLTVEDERNVQELETWYKSDMEVKKSIEEVGERMKAEFKEKTNVLTEKVLNEAVGIKEDLKTRTQEGMDVVREETRDIKDQLGQMHQSIDRLSSAAASFQSAGACLQIRIDCGVTGPVIQGGATGIVITPREPQSVVQRSAVVPFTSNQPQVVVAEGPHEEASGALASQDPQVVQGAAFAPVTSGSGEASVGNKDFPSAQETLNFIAVKYFEKVDPSKPKELNDFILYMEKVRKVLLVDAQSGSLIITVECSSVQILDELWEDYCTGHLNEVAQKFLVTEEILEELGLIAVTLTTTISREEYRACREYLLKNPGGAGSTDFSNAQTEPDQEVKARWTNLSSDFPKDEMAPAQKDEDKKQKDLSWMARAKKAKASRGALHKASISGQYETVKTLLQGGEDVEQKDEFSLTPLHLACWYGQESVVNLLLEHGADINALDRFQRTPLQKAEHRNHQSIVQLLLRRNANPSYQQPLSLKELSKKAFLHVDIRSGLNRLQAAVFDGEDSVVFIARVFLDNFVKEMNFKTTREGDNLSSQEKKGPGYAKIQKIYQEEVENEKTLTGLHWCKCGENTQHAVELVLNFGMDINTPALGNLTPLLWASPSSSSTFIKTLIDLGANVNAQRTDDKATPLHLAASWNHYMAILMLLEQGADTSIQDVNGGTPLHWSVKNDHEYLVKLLLENNPDVNIQDYDGYAPLHWSVINGHENLVKLLLEHKADVNIKIGDGNTPLHLSVVYGHENLVKLLLENNANVNIQNAYGDTPLHLSARDGHENLVKLLLENNANVHIQNVCGDTPLHLSARDGRESLLKLLLENKPDVNIRGSDGCTPLYLSVRNGHENFVKLLLENNADVNIQDYDGYTPLYLSVTNGHENLVKLLLEHKADANIHGRYGDTPLHMSVGNGHENLVKLLLENNANINIQDRFGYTPLHWSIREGHENLVKLLLKNKPDVNIRGTSDGYTPLYLSVRNGHENFVKLLLENNADINIQDYDGYAPLHWSVINGHENLVKLLLEHKADVNIKISDGGTPLHFSVENKHDNLVKLLLENNADVNIQDDNEDTPLHLSVRNGDKKIVKLLLENKADVNMQDIDEYTSLHWSVIYGHENLLKLLLEYNADVNIQGYDGYTPLHLSVEHGHENLLKLLLEHNADINIKDSDGHTPLCLSIKNGHENLVSLLLENMRR